MIYLTYILICISVIIVIGQPRTICAAMVNLAMMVMIIWTLICAALWYFWGIPVKDIIERTI